MTANVEFHCRRTRTHDREEFNPSNLVEGIIHPTDEIFTARAEAYAASLARRRTYIPNGKVVGLSKMDRVTDAFARRLQVQERMTSQIANAKQFLQPQSVAVWISARHMCIESRGVQHANSETITTALRGVFRTDDAARAEFLALARS